MLWDANGLAPGMNKELEAGLSGIVDELLFATTDNHYVNVKPGGFNPLSDFEGLLPSAKQALEEAIADISSAESAMGTVYVDGVEILGQGKQDKISAAATIILSAIGSNNSPNLDSSPSSLANIPSKKSVNDAIINNTKAVRSP